MPKSVVREVDALGELVQAAIQMLEATGEFERGDTRYAAYDGYCARACSAYKYLIDNDERARTLAAHPEVAIKYRKDGEKSHYWLLNSQGEVLDLNYARGDRPPKRYPYHQGRGASLRRDKKDPRLPARKDSQRIIEVVQATLGPLVE
jgi:hypothetical protein